MSCQGWPGYRPIPENVMRAAMRAAVDVKPMDEEAVVWKY